MTQCGWWLGMVHFSHGHVDVGVFFKTAGRSALDFCIGIGVLFAMDFINDQQFSRLESSPLDVPISILICWLVDDRY